MGKRKAVAVASSAKKPNVDILSCVVSPVADMGSLVTSAASASGSAPQSADVQCDVFDYCDNGSIYGEPFSVTKLTAKHSFLTLA